MDEIVISLDEISISSLQIVISSDEIVISSQQIVISSDEIVISSHQIVISLYEIVISSHQIPIVFSTITSSIPILRVTVTLQHFIIRNLVSTGPRQYINSGKLTPPQKNNFPKMSKK